MKKTTIKIQEDLLNRINRFKYKWQLKSHDAVVRRLFEICSKIENAKSSQHNSSTTPLFSSDDSKGGANIKKEKKE